MVRDGPPAEIANSCDRPQATLEHCLLPAHPRKDIAGRDGARKLTLHDVAGSGAIVRGAEVLLGLELAAVE